MKWNMLLSVIIMLMVRNVSVCAAENTYIVKIDDDTQVCSNQMPESEKYVSATEEELQEYLNAGVVEYYEKDHIITLRQIPEDSSGIPEWNFSYINADKAWNIGCFGNEIKVAIIDSGIYPHEDLIHSILRGYNYVEDNNDTLDNIGHGTFIAGIIAAKDNDKYISGIAHQTKLVPLKCFDAEKDTTTLMITRAVLDAVDVYGCDVINMSLAISEDMVTQAFIEAVEYAVGKGCIVVAAAGNDGNSVEYYPAKCNNVMGVGAIGKNGKLSDISQRSATVDITAPGEELNSIVVNDYEYRKGTSFAAPHITAMAAIARCIDKTITAQEFKQLIDKTARAVPDGTAEASYYGSGYADCGAMIDELLKNTPVYLSPITDGTAVVYNNSGRELVGSGYITGINRGLLQSVEKYDLNLDAGQTARLRYTDRAEIVKAMVWDNNQRPLTKERKTQSSK